MNSPSVPALSATIRASQPVASRRPIEPRKRRAIAVLLDYMTLYAGGYESQVRAAFDARCRAREIDLLLVYGLGIDEPTPQASAHNAIYGMLGPNSVDGIVALTSSIATHCGPQRMAAFMRRYGNLPVCSLGMDVPGLPSVVVDNASGMDALIEHVVREHGRRRIAFLAGTPGHPDAEARFDVYRRVLGRHGIEFCPELVESGRFIWDGGFDAMETILARGVEFDAVVAANDSMAMAAIQALRDHGRRIPHDVAVTGFDDLRSARVGIPPLTTVAQPFLAMADRSIDLLMTQWNGGEAPSRIELPAQFIARHSCGCSPQAARKRTDYRKESDPGPADALRHNAAQIRGQLEQTLRIGGGEPEDARTLLDALQHELDGEEEAFMKAVEDILTRSKDDDERCLALQKGMTCLREQLRAASTPELEDVLHDARELIGLSTARGQVRRRADIDQSYGRLLSFGERVSSALDLSSLRSLLEKSLPVSGVRTAWLSRFPVGTTDELEPLVTLVDGAPADAISHRFNASLLMPPEVHSSRGRKTLLVFPLLCESRNVGVAVFGYAAGTNGYQMMQSQISAALRTVNLHQEVVVKTMLHERSVNERVATAKRMQSLSVLAGGVAHDLNNALGPLVGLPEVMIRELDGLGVPGPAAQDLREDLETIQSATLRASQTIKDLLTLSRQGRTAKEPLDLNHAVTEGFLANSLRALREAHRGVRIVCDPAPEPLFIRGSGPHVGRAVMNLVRNAVEAVQGRGEVRIKTFRLDLKEPISGYETVQPGNYAVVAVSDNGSGIPLHEIGWVFEPFASKKRMSETSGTGLGLAIVHGVIKEHEGFVDVASTVGVGTTFTLYFPRAEECVPPVREPSDAPRGSARILVLDDEPIQLRTARRVLTHLGYEVDCFRSGAEALRRFSEAPAGQSPYDVVLLDMMLNEDADGLQVLEEIRQRFPAQKAIVASGHAPTERVEKAFAEGLGWLAKPYTADALGAAIRDALTSEQRPPSNRPSLQVKRSSALSVLP